VGGRTEEAEEEAEEEEAEAPFFCFLEEKGDEEV